jgi:uncharacterized membrane protein
MKVLLMGEAKRGGHIFAVLRHSGIDVDHSPADADPRDQPNISEHAYDVIVIRKSYSTIGDKLATKIRDAVKQGTGLFMTGGWGTFTGRNIEGVFSGGYKGTPIEEALPVSLLDTDDRVNETLYFVVNDWRSYRRIFGDDMPNYDKAACGCNEVVPKKDSNTILKGVQALYADGKVTLSTVYPILVTGVYGKGKTAAYTSDLSPHWAGNIVDWQKDKTDRTALSPGLELGNFYIRFCSRLISSLAPQK